MRFSLLIVLLTVSVLWSNAAFSQNKLSVLRAGGKSLSIRIDTDYYPNRWTIDPSVKPDRFDVSIKSKPVRVAFIAEKDSVVREIKANDVVDFIVLTPAGDSAYTQIRGLRYVEPALFTTSYNKAHTGKTFVEIPETYELINTVFALTKAAQQNDDLIEKNTPYYKDVIAHFSAYKNEPIVTVMDSILTKNESQYFPLKMDAYAFSLDRKGIIQQSSVYDRVAWGKENSLRPYVLPLQRFAAKTKFMDFYRKHQPYYNQLIRAYQDSLDVASMQTWLNVNFPGTHYDSFKIIFSPLVSGNQSANWFENNGFREAQAHVNFPFPNKSDADFSAKAVQVRNGNIVFTELNHAFINPEADKAQYRKALTSALAKRDAWIDERKPAKNYDNTYACFNEYMNWGLVSLRYVDFAPKNELPALLKRIETMMVNYRGFKKFAEFNQFLVPLYQHRHTGTTVADLYPQIINWFETNKQQN
ncbi:DUF4932 domain-containing protein [Spirosoma validum]|uniref:5'-nucleotidase n=1 Tax=Spirosoma validum TaxID=2771355 RepID=A0A927B837_9BACT|nr:DUF4932 domain-containing protein [Spirosoma validum]MBD2756946.1 DUF4932 domain-containing protein [Spirosoma validum]